MTTDTKYAIGLFKHNVRLEKNVPIPTESGGDIDTYQLLLTTKGYLKKRNGFRTLEASETVMNSTYELVIRYQAALANEINNRLKVICQNRIFTIDSYELVDERQCFYKLILKEAQ